MKKLQNTFSDYCQMLVDHTRVMEELQKEIELTDKFLKDE